MWSPFGCMMSPQWAYGAKKLLDVFDRVQLWQYEGGKTGVMSFRTASSPVVGHRVRSMNNTAWAHGATRRDI